MTQEEYLKRFEEKCKAEIELTRRKNADYAGVENAFKNFELIEYLTGGRISAAEGLLVRMSDKLIRFANLLSRPAQVKDEKITDTLDDLSVYAKITSIVLEEESGAEKVDWSAAVQQITHEINSSQDLMQGTAPTQQFSNLADQPQQPNFFVEWMKKMQGAQ